MNMVSFSTYRLSALTLCCVTLSSLLLTPTVFSFSVRGVTALTLRKTLLQPTMGSLPISELANETHPNLSNGEPQSGRGNGLTGAECGRDGDCKGSRSCVTIAGSTVVSCKAASFYCLCFSFSIDHCSDSNQCKTGERCSRIEADGAKANICLSKKEADLLRLSEVNSCIAASALQNMRREDLVFDEDRFASVLCDSSGSCATPGHMVVFKGRGMMMKSYCAIVRCQKRQMKVNSPKYRRGLRIPSDSEHLQFSAFAAKYESSPEELAMSTVIRLGL